MIKATLFAALAGIAVTGTSVADEQLTTKTGVIHAVDFSTYTLSLEDAKGNVEAYSFTPDTRTLVEGRAINLRRALKPGHEVEIKFRASKREQASL